MRKIFSTFFLLFFYFTALAQVCFVDGQDRFCILDLEQRKITHTEAAGIQSQNLLRAYGRISDPVWDSSYWASCSWLLDPSILYTRTWGEHIYLLTPDRLIRSNAQKPILNYEPLLADATAKIRGAYFYADSIYLSTDSGVYVRSLCMDKWQSRMRIAPFQQAYPVLGNFVVRHHLDGKLSISSMSRPEAEIVVTSELRDTFIRSISLEALYLLGKRKLYRIHPLTRNLEVLLELRPGHHFIDMGYAQHRIYVLSSDGTVAAIDLRDEEIKAMMYIEENLRSIAVDEYVAVAKKNAIYCLEKENLKVSHKINVKAGIRSEVWAIRP